LARLAFALRLPALSAIPGQSRRPEPWRHRPGRAIIPV
jgi:hypothetical protein